MEMLRPCPFCGGKARLIHDTDIFSISVYSVVKCRRCNASSGHFKESHACSSDEKAIEAWNKRVSEEKR